LQSWYGVGQSLLMLPQDMIGAFFENLPIFSHYKKHRSHSPQHLRELLYKHSRYRSHRAGVLRLLRQFGFTINHSLAAVLALLLATTHLHYTQNMMENNYIFLLTVTGFCSNTNGSALAAGARSSSAQELSD